MNKESIISKEDYTFYEDGRIYSKAFTKNRFLEGNVNTDGYVQVMLKCTDGKRRNFYWHRVIWFAFNGEIPDGMQVNHIDENKQNNALSNLNLMTPKENVNWGTATKRHIDKIKGSLNHMFGKHHSEEVKAILSKKLTNNPLISKQVVAVDIDDNVVYEFPSTQEAERNGFNKGCVSECCRNCYGKLGNFYKGYRWFYKDEWEKIVLLKYIFEELPTEKD